MKCSYHPDLDSASACVVCSRPLCPSCSHSVKGRVYCQDCIVDGASLAAVARKPEIANYSPARAALAGIIPGIGAVYNRQYSKAVVHFATFAGLILLADYGPEIFVLAVISFYVYTIVDAYRSAQYLLARRIQDPAFAESGDEEMRLPVWGGLLVLLGVLFFLSNLGVLSLREVTDVGWPLLFVAAGIYLILSYYLRPAEKRAESGYRAPSAAGSWPAAQNPAPPEPPSPPAESNAGGE